MASKQINILAISGSLKTSSINSLVLLAMSEFDKENVTFTLYDGLEKLPQFNPDKEDGSLEVVRLKSLIRSADGIIISTPEYAFGVPGSLKNALDWTVHTGEFNAKSVIAISVSPMYEGGKKALASLLLTLSALGAKMTEQSSLSIPDAATKFKDGKMSDEQTLVKLKKLYQHFIEQLALQNVK